MPKAKCVHCNEVVELDEAHAHKCEHPKPFRIEITGPEDFHCFRLTITPASHPDRQIEIMLHARSLVDLIHECSVALCEWQAQTTGKLLDQYGAADLKAKS